MRLWMIAAALGLIAADGPAAVASEPGAAGGEKPRFLSLRAAKTNVRFGPGRRYPIAWVFVRRGLPVQVVGRFETWRRIRDWEGSEGWVHRSLLSGRRSVIVFEGPAALRRKPDAKASPVARVERRVVGRLIRCDGAWCSVEFSGRNGWIRKKAIWGVGKADR